MKPAKLRSLTSLLPLLLAASWAGTAAGKDCDGRYYAASDHQNRVPLRQPSAEFSASLEKAKAGDAVQQRSIAARYESGYLVSRCAEEAARWYYKAAESGDEIARKWVSRQQALKSLSEGAECVANGCSGSSLTDETRIAVLHANIYRGKHYFAPVTINGRTVEGIIDTGASVVAMSEETAKAFGIKFSGAPQGISSTANGKITTYRVVVPQIEVAGIKVRNVPVSIGITGELLVGMSFLSQLDVSIQSDTLTMKKRQ